MRNNKFVHISKKGVVSTSANPVNAPAEISPFINPLSSDSFVYPCTQWQEKLISTHHDDLSFEERLELEKHLEECSSCSAIRRHDRVIDSLIRQLPFRDLPSFEIKSDLPPVLKRLWEFEDMQRDLPEGEKGESLSSEVQLAELSQEYENTSREEEARQSYKSKKTKLEMTRYRIVISSTLVLAVIFSTLLLSKMSLGSVVIIMMVAIIIMTTLLVWLLIENSHREETDVAQKRKKFHQTLRTLVPF